MAGGAVVTTTHTGPFLTGRKLIFPLSLAILLFFLWGFSYGLLDVLNKHFQNVLKITKLQSTGLQIVYFGGGYLCFSPIAAEVLKRRGYRITIIMGLSLFALGAICFWPTAHFSTVQNAQKAFGGFIACTFVIACGLATLETAANSYATVIGDPKSASMRLQFCQAWNGVASFIGPLIASKFFFSGANADNLVNVQYVYLAVACAAVVVGILFFFAKMPETSTDDNDPNGITDISLGKPKPLWKHYNMVFGFVAQFCYVGAQVTIGSFFINYCVENASYSDADASNLLSYALIIFTVGRFVGVGLAHFFQTNLILLIYAIICFAFSAYLSAGHGKPAVGVLISIYFFESIMYPSIFVLGTANLGVHTRRGAGILVMGVSGGAVFPPIQGAIADRYSTRVSFLTPMVGFIFVMAYALYHWISNGRKIRRDRKTVEVIVVPTPGQKKSSVFISSDPVDTFIDHNRKRSGMEDVQRLDGGNVEMGSYVDPSRSTSLYNPNTGTYTNQLTIPTAAF